MFRSTIVTAGLIAGFALATTANAAPVTVNFEGLAFNGGGGNASWTVFHPSSGPMDGNGTVTHKLLPHDLNIRDFSYSIEYDSDTQSFDANGGLHNASLKINETNFLMLGQGSRPDVVMQFEESTLTIKDQGSYLQNVNTPAGKADPSYGVVGDIDFKIYNAAMDTVLYDSVFRLSSNPDINGGNDRNPFNGLAVGTGGAGNLPQDDVVFFIWAASIDPDPNGFWDANANNPFLGIDIALWGTPIDVPAPAGMLLLGFGLAGLISVRRKHA